VGEGNYALLDAGGRTVSTGFVTSTGSSADFNSTVTYFPTVTIYPGTSWWDYGRLDVTPPSTRVEPRTIPWQGSVYFPPDEAPALAPAKQDVEDRFRVELPGERVIELD